MNKNITIREEGQFILVVEEGSLVLTIRALRNLQDGREVHLFDEEIIKLRDFLNSEVEVLEGCWKKEVKKMTKINEKEYEFLKSLDDKWKWIARDYPEDLFAYRERPKWFEETKTWENLEDDYVCLENDLFKFIQWEYEKPHSIDELIEEYEKEHHIKNVQIVNIDAADITGSVH